MSEAPYIFDRSLLRRRRMRAAPAADAHAFLLERFGDDVAERLQLIQRTFARALVVGSHHGLLGRMLGQSRAIPWIVETETCPALLDRTSQHKVLADEEALPFASASFDLVIAGLTLQFVNDLPGTLLQIRQSLRPDGLFLGGMFGGATLSELRRSWIEAETEILGGVSPRVSPFADVRDLGGLLQRAGFALPVVDSDTITVRYPSALALMQDLRGMGAGNVLADRSRVPVSRRLLMRAAEIYAERFGEPSGRVPATFELMVLTAWAPHETQQKPLQPGSAAMRLADALGVPEGRLKPRDGT